MANSAFTHEPSFTIPGSTTDNAVIRWDGTSGAGQQNSGILIDDSNVLSGITSLTVDNLNINGNTVISTDTNGNITFAPNGSGSVVADTVGNSEMSFNGTVLDLKNNGTQSSIKLYCETGNAHYQEIRGGPHSGATSYTMVLPHVPPTANQVLTTASISSNVAVLDWADAAGGGGTTVTGTVDNALLTFINSNSEFTAEANLTFTGSLLSINSNYTIDDTNGFRYPSQSNYGMRLNSGSDISFAIDSGNTHTDKSFRWYTNGLNGGGTQVLQLNEAGRFTLGLAGSRIGIGIDNPGATLDITGGTGWGKGDNDFQMRSSNVSHGMTNQVDTDVYLDITKGSQTYGGFILRGWSDNGAYGPGALMHANIATGEQTERATGAVACLELRGSLKSGSSTGAMGANKNLIAFRNHSTTRFIFDTDGDGHADSSWTTYSDGRLKFNQEVIPYGLDTLMQLQPKVYDRDSGYLKDGVPVLEGKRRRQIGFIAQEVKAIIPEVIKDVEDENKSWYSLDDGKLMAVVIKAIQELKAEVDALKS